MAQTKSMSYDAPAYLAVLPVALAGTSTLAGGAQTGLWAAGAGTISYKFVAFTNMIVKSVTTACVTTVGTGVTLGFTMGSAGTGNAPALIRVTNNGTTHSTFVTGTYQMGGAQVLPQGAAALTTACAVVNWTPQTAYSTAIGTSGASVNAVTGVNNWALVNGGIPLSAGDTIHFVKGADATEVIGNPVLECVLQPFAGVSP
jgi:hypothetical protein